MPPHCHILDLRDGTEIAPREQSPQTTRGRWDFSKNMVLSMNITAFLSARPAKDEDRVLRCQQMVFPKVFGPVNGDLYDLRPLQG